MLLLLLHPYPLEFAEFHEPETIAALEARIPPTTFVSKPILDRSWGGTVEQWRPLVETWFPADQVATAMRVMQCESGGNPNALGKDGDSGLFQHLKRYWSDRSAKAGWAGADIYDPTANVAVAAWLQRTGGWGHWSCY